jgi:hypothetical protein
MLKNTGFQFGESYRPPVHIRKLSWWSTVLGQLWALYYASHDKEDDTRVIQPTALKAHPVAIFKTNGTLNSGSSSYLSPEFNMGKSWVKQGTWLKNSPISNNSENKTSEKLKNQIKTSTRIQEKYLLFLNTILIIHNMKFTSNSFIRHPISNRRGNVRIM